MRYLLWYSTSFDFIKGGNAAIPTPKFEPFSNCVHVARKYIKMSSIVKILFQEFEHIIRSFFKFSADFPYHYQKL